MVPAPIEQGLGNNKVSLFQICIAKAFNFFCKAVGILPFSIRSRLGLVFGYLFSLLPTKDKKVALLQIHKLLNRDLNYSQLDIKNILKGCYRNLGRNVFECLNLYPLLEIQEEFFRSSNQALLEDLIRAERPIIALTAHYGNWDLLAAVMVKKGFRLNVIGREARSPIFNYLLQRIRNDYGAKTIWKTNSTFAIREIINALKKKEVVGVLIDQDTRVSGIPIPFFGKLAHTPSALIALGKKFNSRFVAIVMKRTGLGGQIEIKELESDSTTEQILQQFNEFLEQQIKLAPDQWVWLHKRWRTREDGIRLSSKDYIRYLESL